MRYLLDVNALLALGLAEHQFHPRVVHWLKPERRGMQTKVATCSITELRFVRILSQPAYGYSVEEAKRLLSNLLSISDLQFTFLNDTKSALTLPSWVRKQGQVTDGHLVELAKAQGAVLLTLDQGIPGAFLIPA